MPFRIEALSQDHNRDNFDCGEDDQNDFLRRFALNNRAAGFGTVWVALEDESPDVKGFYTLHTGHIERKQFPGTRQWPRYQRSIVLIGQLARDITVRGQGMGEFLFTDALEKAVEVSRIAGVVAVAIDASTDAGRALYEGFGFQEIYRKDNGVIRLVRTVADIEADFEAANTDKAEDGEA